MASDIVADDALIKTQKDSSAVSRFLRGPTGRCGLTTYYAGLGKALLGLVTAIVVMMVIIIVGMELAGFSGDEGEFHPAADAAVLVSAMTCLVVFFLYYLRLTFRRLHDLGFSAWWSLIFLVPVIGAIFSMYVGLVPGKVEDNRFGAWVRPTRSDKVFSVLGALVTILAIGASVWATSNGYS